MWHAVFWASLLPVPLILWQAATLPPGSGIPHGNEITVTEVLCHEAGQWSLRFLLLCLAVTPLRQLTGIAAIGRFRRMIGLYSAFYLAIHAALYIAVPMEFQLAPMIADLGKLPHIRYGWASFLLMAALTVTSYQFAIRRLGGRRWRALHRLTYPAAALAVVHYVVLGLAKDSPVLVQPAIDGAIFLGLMAVRLAAWLKARRRSPSGRLD